MYRELRRGDKGANHTCCINIIFTVTDAIWFVKLCRWGVFRGIRAVESDNCGGVKTPPCKRTQIPGYPVGRVPWPRRGVARGLLVSGVDVGAAYRPPLQSHKIGQFPAVGSRPHPASGRKFPGIRRAGALAPPWRCAGVLVSGVDVGAAYRPPGGCATVRIKKESPSRNWGSKL